MRNSFFSALVNSGLDRKVAVPERRVIILSNYISLIIALAILILFFALPQNINVSDFFFTLFEIVIFCLPIAFNRIGLTTLSRFYLSWAPPILVTWYMILGMRELDQVPAATYDGLRLYLLAFSCIPYLLRSKERPILFILAVLPSFVLTLFSDQILSFFGVGPAQVGFALDSYSYNPIRTFLAYLIINGICFLLKWIIDEGDRINDELVHELESKNDIIKQSAEVELRALNNKLALKVQELMKRELALEESQRIAKVGSWEYNFSDGTSKWSQQMFEIYDADNDVEVRYPPVIATMLEDAEARELYRQFDLINIKGHALDITVPIHTLKGSKKWIRLIAYPSLVQDQMIGVNGIVHDITHFKESEERLQTSESNYRSLFEQATDAIMLTDHLGNFQDANPAFLSMLGYEKDEIVKLNLKDIIDYEQLAAKPIPFDSLLSGGRVTNERFFARKDGSKIAVEVNARGIGQHQLLGIARDVSERNEAAQRQLKYIRELALLNTVNQLISQENKVDDLLKRLAEILVNEGDYRLAWIGQDRRPHSSRIEPQFVHGPAQSYVNGLAIDLDNEQQRLGPTAQSIIQGRYQVVNQLYKDEKYKLWLDRAKTFGFQASMAIPISAKPIACYVLNLYAEKQESFDTIEIDIIQRLVTNVATAIRSINAAEERDRAKTQLEAAYERINYHITNTPLAVIERDKELRITYWNKRAEEIFGWTAQEVLGKKAHEILSHPEDTERVNRLLDEIEHKKLKSSIHQRRNLTKKGDVLHTIWYYSIVRDSQENLQTILSFVSDISQQKYAAYQLNERIKELTALYKVSQIISHGEKDIDGILKDVAMAVKEGFQFPAICEVAIQFNSFHYQTKKFVNTDLQLHEPFILNGTNTGCLEVVYTKNYYQGTPVDFYQEEKSLLRVVAEMLQIYIIRKQEEEALQTAQANLEATINNTELMIWSVDRSFNLLTFNTPFYEYNQKVYDVKVNQGFNHRSIMSTERSAIWEDRYNRALMGESFVEEDSVSGNDFRFSFSPIIEKNKILGVSVFADNVTEKNKQSRELIEANRLIGDLKVRALRSVMNPHFIFNVLNSIQFFIAKNEKLNAINYLSTFSKLIRQILTSSVADTITLAEEMELLKNYIELEKVRFEEKFSYIIEMDDDIVVEDIQIPSLLTQPYVENSILHGLYNKHDKGLLIIRVRQEDDFIIFVIEDDGIGREAAQSIKLQQQATHKSVGTKLTEDRLKLLNHNGTVSVFYEDLMKDGKASGTRVSIKIKTDL